ILRRIPAEDRKTFRIVVEDSYETGGQNWTDGLTEKFTERYGYSPLPYLPVLQGIPVGNNEKSDRFLWDLRRLVADLIAYEYVGGLKEISNKHGLTTWLENYGHWGFPSEFLLYGGQSDEIAGEYWSEGTLGDIENRAASSCGHIYGKNKIWSESCTAAGNPFGRYPNVMKQRVDRFFTEGINASLLHLFIHQMETPEEPGIAAWFGNEFNRKNTWFEQLDLFTDYLRRCNYMLQQGRYIADVAYFIGEDAPKMTGECNPQLPEGYSFDYINADILKNHATVKDGRLILDSGMEYSVLVLPAQDTMRPEMLECIENFVKNGLTIVGPAPVRSPSLANYPESDKTVNEIAKRMWIPGQKVNRYKNGNVWNDKAEMSEIFTDLNLKPDLSVENGEQMPLYIHRSLDDAEVYFIANPTEDKISLNPTFRVNNGYIPQLWDATDGTIRTLSQFKTPESGGITVPIELEPLESAFIVFRNDAVAPATYSTNYPTPDIISDLTDKPWTIEFDAKRQGPSQPLTIDSLIDWSTHPDRSIANYSGKAVYTTDFNLPELPEGQTFLDLGKVMVMAKVKINGKYAGGAWTSPYRVNVTELLTAIGFILAALY
ncbi:MAG: glycoside hydrolase family 2, partial [Duncaniella dubosii]|nr:glycoside hydrolase family 2 [Duncaniella dubosii]